MGFFSKIGNAIQNTGAKYNLPEWGVSELFGVGRAQAQGTAYPQDGIPTNDQEAQAMGYPSLDYWKLDNGLITSDRRQDPGLPVNALDTTLEDLTSPAPTDAGDGGETPAPTFQPISYMGKIYYTPEEYTAAVMAHITESYNDSVRQIENNFKNGFITIDERDAEIKKTRTSLVKKKDEDLQSVSAYFNQISPDAIQSGKGKLDAKAVEDYTTKNTQLGSNLGANLYDASGRIRQDLSTTDLQPYMTELSDTGNLARSIAGNYTNRDTNLQAANTAFNSGLDQNANDYIAAQGTAPISDYSAYLNNAIIGAKKPAMAGVGQFSSVKKTDKYGNPIDEYLNK